MSHKKPLQMLTEEQLHKLNTKRLLGVLASARAVKSSLYKQIAQHLDDATIGEELEEKATKATAYFKLVKSIASTREDV